MTKVVVRGQELILTVITPRDTSLGQCPELQLRRVFNYKTMHWNGCVYKFV
jgi:hypothetical protein